MIRWMYGFLRLDKHSNEVIRDKVEVTFIEDKMRKVRSKWFGNIKGMDIMASIQRCEKIDLLDCK